MTKRIFRSICLVALAVLLASLILIMGVLYDYFTRIQGEQLKTEVTLAAQGVAGQGMAYLEELDAGGIRVTWIDPEGAVLYDSQAEAAGMENHLEREEVQEALASGYGESSRYSTTLMERLLYAAKRLPDGSVVRLSSTQNSVITLVLGMLQPVLVIALAAVILALLLASGITKKIIRPLNELNLDEPLSNDGYDELSPLLRRIDSQQRQLRGQEAELRQRRDEFEAVTGSMNEGLVLLNSKGRILSINPMAARLLGTGPRCVGEDILTVNRSLELQELLAKAQCGQQAETVLELNGRNYQMDASPIVSDGAVSGAALLLFDVTEKEKAEQLRREFTANVSHELKTPLHTISGCAELLNNDLVKPEDRKQFTGQIYLEAQRMIRLVEDIIRLSRLDEGAEDMKREDTDLFALAGETVRRLAPEAEAAGVTLALEGETAVLHGIPQLLSGIVYNLCDNAIKYNRPGGKVTVQVKNSGPSVILVVSDTGIGIPSEHQNRIFERFYRVDKSHSKEVGGTGLGLSIVKHAAKIHDARIELSSTVGEGTTITVRFPRG